MSSITTLSIGSSEFAEELLRLSGLNIRTGRIEKQSPIAALADNLDRVQLQEARSDLEGWGFTILGRGPRLYIAGEWHTFAIAFKLDPEQATLADLMKTAQDAYDRDTVKRPLSPFGLLMQWEREEWEQHTGETCLPADENESEYVPMNELLTDADGRFPTYKAIEKALKDNPSIRHREAPPGKRHKREVHIADWHRMTRERTREATGVDDIESRKEFERQKKEQAQLKRARRDRD